MSYDSFWHLHQRLHQFMIKALRFQLATRRKAGGLGEIILSPQFLMEVYLSAFLWHALHYFAGGSPLDFASLYGISYLEAMSSVWITIAAINMCPDFDISYAESLEEQRKNAAEF